MMWSVYKYTRTFIIFVVFFSYFEKCSSEYEGLFASKNPYSKNDMDTLSALEFKKCQILQINGIYRHGTRYAKKKDAERTQELLNLLKSEQNKDIPIELYDWKPNFLPSQEMNLTKAGEKELYMIGKRFKMIYDMINNNKPQNILFMTSNTYRTIGSCTYFMKGFYGEDIDTATEKLAKKCTLRNDLIRFFDSCKYYLNAIVNNDTALNELKLFENGKEIRKTCSDVRKRYNLKKDFPLSYKQLKATYTITGTEIADEGKSVWSEFYTEEELKILEYAADLKSYWKKSYGHEINFEQSCTLLEDIFFHLQAAIENNSGYYHGVFRFGHAETLLPIFSILELFKDETPLTSQNYEKQSHRLFKTGKVSQFAANLAFVLHKCQETYYLQLLHNEKPIHFPCCPNDWLCPYNKVRSYYGKYLENCDFESVCNMKNEGRKEKVEL